MEARRGDVAIINAQGARATNGRTVVLQLRREVRDAEGRIQNVQWRVRDYETMYPNWYNEASLRLTGENMFPNDMDLEVTTLQATINRLESTLVQSRAEINSYRNQVQAHQQANRDQAQTIRSTQAQVAAYVEREESYKKQVHTLQQSVKSQEQILVSTRAQAAAHVEREEYYKKQVQTLQQENRDQAQIAASNRAEVAAYGEQVEHYKRLAQTHEEALNEVLEFQALNDMKQQELEQLLDSSQATEQRLQAQVVSLEQEMTEQQRTSAVERANVVERAERYKKLAQTHEAAMKQLQQTSRALQAKSDKKQQELEQLLDTSRNENNSKHAVIHDLTNSLSAQRSQHEALEQKLKAQIASLQREKTDQEQSLASAQAQATHAAAYFERARHYKKLAKSHETELNKVLETQEETREKQQELEQLLNTSRTASNAQQVMIRDLSNYVADQRSERDELEHKLQAQIESLQLEMMGLEQFVATERAQSASEIASWRENATTAINNYEHELRRHAETRAELRAAQEEARDDLSYQRELAEEQVDAVRNDLQRQLDVVQHENAALEESVRQLEQNLRDQNRLLLAQLGPLIRVVVAASSPPSAPLEVPQSGEIPRQLNINFLDSDVVTTLTEFVPSAYNDSRVDGTADEGDADNATVDQTDYVSARMTAESSTAYFSTQMVNESSTVIDGYVSADEDNVDETTDDPRDYVSTQMTANSLMDYVSARMSTESTTMDYVSTTRMATEFSTMIDGYVSADEEDDEATDNPRDYVSTRMTADSSTEYCSA